MPGPKNIRVRMAALVGVLVVLGSSSTSDALAQSDYPNFGFRSYCNSGRSNYSGGMVGRSTNNSFNTGFSGLSQTYNGATCSTQRSTQAAQGLAREVSAIWSKVAGSIMQQPQQSMAQAQKTLSQ